MNNSFPATVRAALAALLLLAAAATQAADTRCFEMRTYYANAGKLDALHARFRDHTIKLFAKHGMTNIGYWVPVENPDSKLIYLLAYPSRDAREKAWKAFLADPDWIKAKAESEKNGPLVARNETQFLTLTDYSPDPKPSKAGDARLFELRIYTATPNNLGNLNARFRDHTVKLFEKHGMTNIGYWTPMPDQKDADKLLVYLIAHKNRESRDAGFKAFGTDPDWKAALKASEEKGGGPLTIKGGVQYTFLKPTDYSVIK
jgi:hypothetical protein